MKVFLAKKAVLTASTTVGLSVLAAGSAQAASFNWSYSFDPANTGGATVVVSGMVDGDLVGDTLTNVSNIMATVTANESVTLATFDDSDFISRVFTVSGAGLDVFTDNSVQPFLELVDGSDAKYSQLGFIPTESFNQDSWSLTPKDITPVPEGNMGLVSWLALATIGGVSMKYGKKKSLVK